MIKTEYRKQNTGHRIDVSDLIGKPYKVGKFRLLGDMPGGGACEYRAALAAVFGELLL